MKTKTTRQEALERISGWIMGESVIYYDDTTHLYYVGPASDLDDLAQIMDDDDELVAADAYSHWCAGTSHGSGYETQEEAEAAARK